MLQPCGLLNLTGDSFQEGLLEAPLYPLKPGVSRGHPVFQMGQALSGPLVIRPLHLCASVLTFSWLTFS